MTRFVPVVAVVEESVLERLQDWIARTEPSAADRDLIATCEAHLGWTHEMVALGALLRAEAREMGLL